MQIKEFFYHLRGEDLFVTKRHFHNDIEIIEVISGEGVVIKNNCSYHLKNRHLYIIDARHPHIVNPTDVAEYVRNKIVIDADSFFVFFNEIGMYEFAQKLLNSPPIPTMDNSQIDQLFYNIQKLCSESDDGKGFAHAYILELLHIAFKSPLSMTQVDDGIIQKMLNEINNADGNITLSVLSQHLNYNKYYLCHIFREKTGISLSSYIDEKRNAFCIQQLINTEDSIAFISEKCGFINASSFTRFFKNKNGISPLKYRNIHKPNK